MSPKGRGNFLKIKCKCLKRKWNCHKKKEVLNRKWSILKKRKKKKEVEMSSKGSENIKEAEVKWSDGVFRLWEPQRRHAPLRRAVKKIQTGNDVKSRITVWYSSHTRRKSLQMSARPSQRCSYYRPGNPSEIWCSFKSFSITFT